MPSVLSCSWGEYSRNSNGSLLRIRGPTGRRERGSGTQDARKWTGLERPVGEWGTSGAELPRHRANRGGLFACRYWHRGFSTCGLPCLVRAVCGCYGGWPVCPGSNGYPRYSPQGHAGVESGLRRRWSASAFAGAWYLAPVPGGRAFWCWLRCPGAPGEREVAPVLKCDQLVWSATRHEAW
jgi:hypothetical protein